VHTAISQIRKLSAWRPYKLGQSVRHKKILYLAHGDSIGGGQRQLLYLIENLDRRLYEPLVVCPTDGRFADALTRLGAKVFVCPLHPWRKFPALLYRYFDAQRLVRYASEHNVSLIHCSNLWLSGYMHYLAARLKVPSILHVRTPLCPRDVRKHRCDKTDIVIAISSRVKRDLLQGGVCEEKIAQIDDGVDVRLFQPNGNGNVLAQDYPASGDLRIGIAGRVCEAKRQLDFLKAAEAIRESVNKKISFFVIGNYNLGKYYRRLRNFVESNGLNGNVFFTGERQDMPEVLTSLDVLVSLSGGSVMFEAMSCGTPVVSAGFTSYENSVHLQDGRTGLLVPSRHTADLVKAIRTLLESGSLRNTISRQAREWAVLNLNHQKLVRCTQQLYDGL